jgi:hypothetical protein
MKKTILKWLFEAFFVAGILLFGSCATQYRSKLYADVIGFNDDVTLSYNSESPPYNLAEKKGIESLNNSIKNLPQGENTAAYYALDVALNRVEEVQKKYMEGDPDSKYYIVFFTDGLENASRTQHNKKANLLQKKYDTNEEYSDVLQVRMKNILKRYSLFGLLKKNSTTNSFQSYVLLHQGDDIKMSGYTDEELDQKLSVLIGAQNAPPQKVIQNSDLVALKEDFKRNFIVSSFSFVIPTGYVGSRIRMVLNKDEDESNKVYFEADFKKIKKTLFRKEQYFLENLTTNNDFAIDKPATGMIKMDKNAYDETGNTIRFTIRNLRQIDKKKDDKKQEYTPYKVKREDVDQWYYENGKLRLNSEYNSKAGVKKNVYILLVMDTSKSFREKIEEAKEAAKEIVLYISEEM